MYRLDGKLIAMAVLDILPNCVSSVYFVYDPAWEKFSLGKVLFAIGLATYSINVIFKLSALREVALVREMNDAGAPGLDWLYMGKSAPLPFPAIGVDLGPHHQAFTYIPAKRCDTKGNTIPHILLIR
jgi:hypothetical protein